MKYAYLISPSRKLCFAMALAAGMVAIPLPTMANQAVQNRKRWNSYRFRRKL